MNRDAQIAGLASAFQQPRMESLVRSVLVAQQPIHTPALFKAALSEFVAYRVDEALAGIEDGTSTTVVHLPAGKVLFRVLGQGFVSTGRPWWCDEALYDEALQCARRHGVDASYHFWQFLRNNLAVPITFNQEFRQLARGIVPTSFDALPAIVGPGRPQSAIHSDAYLRTELGSGGPQLRGGKPQVFVPIVPASLVDEVGVPLPFAHTACCDAADFV